MRTNGTRGGILYGVVREDVRPLGNDGARPGADYKKVLETERMVSAKAPRAL